MWTIIFLITTAVCAIGWLVECIVVATILHHAMTKHNLFLEEEDMRESTTFVVKQLFNRRKR